ncbi:hypothetical protein ASG40_11365 [Methylobacterium sp. Leaf399]|uniref:alpha/beta hydrolase n=1 Tax=Methylobacterium sp. Leaf399 TaxID=1736364 RepID=UPI0006F64378|nr:alpha/beta fold hydrolase [Methylobacterium sp. Leaf399]KQT09223.1 hypothetical protein ASG40_11365 [Methylobacterium sp. Leaf399]
MMRPAGYAALFAAGTFAVALAYEGAVRYLRAQVFQPDPGPITAVTRDGVAFSPLTLTRADGTTVTGLQATGSRPGKAVVVYLHGNGGSALTGAHDAAILATVGYDLVIADYAGYGGNPGSPSQSGLVADADAFLARGHVIAEGRPLLLIGHSLGGALAVLVAEDAPIAGLLTIGAVARLSDLVPVLARPFLRDRFDALASASRVTAPWLIAHGEADEVVPASDAVRLAGARAQSRRELDIATGLAHPVEPASLLGLTERLFAMRARS